MRNTCSKLYNAVQSGEVEDVKTLLNQEYTDPNFKNVIGHRKQKYLKQGPDGRFVATATITVTQSALYLAVASHNTEIIDALLKHKKIDAFQGEMTTADTWEIDDTNFSPLSKAVSLQHWDTVKQFLDHYKSRVQDPNFSIDKNLYETFCKDIRCLFASTAFQECNNESTLAQQASRLALEWYIRHTEQREGNTYHQSFKLFGRTINPVVLRFSLFSKRVCIGGFKRDEKLAAASNFFSRTYENNSTEPSSDVESKALENGRLKEVVGWSRQFGMTKD